ncbi:cell division protein FtsZ [Flagellimonas taeanensis]|jgi:cell division protein FtsZ|uniref:Cell division protein FtsZ n=1 Tax=Flagellimonas taeanensis TaxID=1005926 RepID=A0A1M6TXE2_9FLAO|nr:cell division protein FtsZ [Allomuricauda taeanensis]MEE1962371.1 cell division protein FtsZ [Allomuricauda taeanensis]SFB91051.1 cell division protein FtsZ [Allomuricauda taeanensis]SHK61478.1 cell division protein FtsZ [Allomuricauda taeanensis]
MSKNTEFDNIAFDLPKNKSNVIKVIGVGGGGSNAINHMFQAGINGVDFVICNTDAQALQNSSVPNKIQLGVSLTEGLGAGANPDVGEQAALESMEEIKGMLGHNTKMAFITAGMGGGTGTGAAPILAKLAKELDILTVGIVTIPFQFEGAMRNKQAQLGIEKLRANVDSLIVINNNKLREVYGNLGFKAGFSKADEVLATAARGIAEVITHHYTQNIDLRDAKTVLSNSGTAIMGSAVASGSARATEAIMKALDSPLLNDNKINGAKNVLLLIVSGSQEITIDEIGEINDHIQIEAGHGANIIMGVGEDENLGEAIAVTVIATGFNVDQQDNIVNTESKKVFYTLEDEQTAQQDLTPEATAVQEMRVEKAPIVEPEPEPTVVKHTLEMKEEEVEERSVPKAKMQEPDLVPTTSYIRNFNVFYEEVVPEYVDDDFIIIEAKNIINNIEVVEPEVVAPKSQEDQFTLSFDMPLHNEVEEEEDEREHTVTFNLDDGIGDVRVNEYVEVKPVLEYKKQGETRYNLEEYMELETKLTGAKSMAETHEPKLVENELVFEKKTLKVEAANQKEETTDSLDPFNSSISDLLKDRADERRRKLKNFNYKFQNNRNSIDEIEKQPAYKRQGVDLNDVPKEQKVSRTTLSEDSNDDLQLRSNNSFLHDNVD